MKNFISIENNSILSSIKETLVTITNLELSEFLQQMSSVQHNVHKQILFSSFVKMYSIPLRYTNNKLTIPGTFQAKDTDKVFTFRVESPEQNHNNGKGFKVKEIESTVDTKVYPSEKLFFSQTTSLIPKSAHTAWIMFYKKHATVLPHSHDDTTILAHFLLSDVLDGEFVITIGGEERKMCKAGDYFIFCGEREHSAVVTGRHAKFVVFAIEKEDFFKINCK